MSPVVLILIAAGGIAGLLTLILGLRMQPFVALVLVSIVVALAAGIAPGDLVTTIEDGMGKTLGHIALVIALGAMIGRMIEVSGGAHAFATALVERFGARRAPLALAISGFFIGIPVFFEVGVVMLMPLAYGVARRTGRPLLVFALPMCIAVLIVHALLPPHPGAVAAAGLLHADIGRNMLWGLPIAAATTAFAYFLCGWMTRGRSASPGEIAVLEEQGAAMETGPLQGAETPPGLALVGALVLVPIVLILSATLAATILPAGSVLRSILTVAGTPFVALLIDVLLCAYLLGVRRGWSLDRVSDVLGAAIPGVAMVILVTGAGGVFAKVLVTAGIGAAISGMLHASGLPVLVLAFLVTMLLRVAQGPTTVALITTAGLIGPFVASAGFNANQLSLVCLAMGAGGLCASHVNDAGFWIVTRMIGLSVADGLRSWTVLTTLCGCFAFAMTVLLWQFA